jgi:multimeric flavodoxin WrbA
MSIRKNMKIVAVLGSPRLNGNSTFIAERFLETANNLGAETQSFALNKLKYQGCQACRACKKSLEVCVIKDDLTDVLDAVRKADVVVLAAPVYFGDISGQMKLFIDRTYSFLTPDFHSNPKGSRLFPGKTGIFILTQGLSETMFTDVFTRYEWVMKMIGIERVYPVRGCNLARPDDVRKCEELLKQVDELVTLIMGRKAN